MTFVDAWADRPIATLPTRLVTVVGIDHLMETVGKGATAMAIVHKIAVAAEISPEIVIANVLVIDRYLLIVGRTQAIKIGVPLGIDPVLLIVSRIALLQVNVLSTQKHINSTRRRRLKPMPKSERVSPSLLHSQLGSTPLKRLTSRRRVQPILLRLRPCQSRRPLIVP